MRCGHRLGGGHAGSSVLSVAVSAGVIFAGLQDGRILEYDDDTYTCIRELRHDGPVLSLVVSHARLISSAGDSTVKVWDLLNRSREPILTVYSVYDVGDIFSTACDGDRLWIGCQNTSIQWVDISVDDEREIEVTANAAKYRERPHKFFDSNTTSVTRRRPSLTMRTVLQIDEDDVVQYAHYSYVLCLLVGRYRGRTHLFSGGGDGAVNVWSRDEMKPVSSLVGEHPVNCLAQRDSLLFAGQSGGGICVWELETDQLLRRVNAHTHDILALAVWGDRLFSCAGRELKSWAVRGQLELESTEEAHAKVLCCAAGAACLVTGGSDNDVAVWRVGDLSTGGGGAGGQGRDEDADAFLASLATMCAFRSVSGSDRHIEDCHLAAAHLKHLGESLGAEAHLLPTQHNPVVLLSFRGSAPRRRSLLFYGHYDVISADEKSWKTSPWRLAGRDGYLYARGVSDNKGPVLSALYAASEARSSDVDIHLVIEGEEESGSRGFREAVEGARAKGLLPDHVDEIFLSNSYWLDDHTPCLTYGLRGVIRATVTVDAPDRPDLHSGVEGGTVREPMSDLFGLVASLSRNGEITLPGFYDAVRGASAGELDLYGAVARRVKDTSVRRLEQKWSLPSLTVHKVDVSGPGNHTVIPARATAHLSIRIVPDQSLEKVAASLREFLETGFAALDSGNVLHVDIGHTADWWLSPPESAAHGRSMRSRC
ncbi:hypothetical protein PYCC9005_005479 [Savitreella phatthalungensis]